MSSDIGTCRSCPAKVRWVTMEHSGKKNPLDRMPDPVRGNVQLIGNEAVRARVVKGQELDRLRRDGAELFTSHFATCPNGPAHRKRPTSGAAAPVGAPASPPVVPEPPTLFDGAL